MCKVWAEECDNCNARTDRFSLIELCDPYRTATKEKRKWISGHPNRTTTNCKARFENELIPVGDYTCAHCNPPPPASDTSDSVPEADDQRPRVHTISQNIISHEELVQLAIAVAILRSTMHVQGIVDAVMREFGTDRFHDWDRESICMSVTYPETDLSLGADVDIDALQKLEQ